jgi:hypothetical protein
MLGSGWQPYNSGMQQNIRAASRSCRAALDKLDRNSEQDANTSRVLFQTHPLENFLFCEQLQSNRVTHKNVRNEGNVRPQPVSIVPFDFITSIRGLIGICLHLCSAAEWL